MVNVLSVVPVIVLQHEPGDGVGAGVPPLGVGVRVGVGSVRVGVGPVGVPSGNDAVRSGGVGVAVVPVGVGVVWQVSQKLTASDAVPNALFGTSVATHGSPHEYDNHVPLLVWGPAWVQPGSRAAPVEVTDIAPTLAGLLRVAAPAASEGRPLPLAR